MNKGNEGRLENQYNWDFERSAVRKPVKSPRMVVSVAFKRDDFEVVSKYAERLGKKISEFIREASLEKALGRESVTSIQGFGSDGALWSMLYLPYTTQVQGRVTAREEAVYSR